MGINIADIVLAALLLLAVLYGWRQGTINVVAQAGSLVLAYQAARSLSGKIAAYLIGIIPPPADGGNASEGALSFLSIFVDSTGAANRVVEIIVFIVIFILVNWLVRKLARMLTGIFGRGIFGKINRAIGAFIALVLMLIIIVIIDDIILPACIKMGFGQSVADFMNGSGIMMPFIDNLASLF